MVTKTNNDKAQLDKEFDEDDELDEKIKDKFNRKRKISKKEAIKERWGDDILKEGHTAIPNLFLTSLNRLELNSTEALTLIMLTKYWWKKDGDVIPSQSTLAREVGLSSSNAMNKVIKKLATKKVDSLMSKNTGLITITHRAKKSGGKASNSYRFDGLLEALNNLSEEIAKQTNKSKTRNRVG